MANKQNKEVQPFTSTEISADNSELLKILSSPYFAEKDRKARERLKKSPIPKHLLEKK
jgi:hypothetical protein